MSYRGPPFGRESRWLSLGIMLATLACAPQAQAAGKIDNAKFVSAFPPGCTAAYQPSFAPMSAATSRVLLGGAPSALDRIRLIQAGGEAMGVSNAPAATVPMAEPAGRGIAPLRQNCGSLPLAGGLSTAPAFRAPIAEPGSEFGTRAIPIKHTRFDDRWARVRRAAPAALMRSGLHSANAGAGLDEAELLSRVNIWVNQTIAYVSDDRNYGQSDLWAPAEQTLARRRGDCEDFAILKMQLLRAAGIDTARMKLVLLRDLAANSDHAILLVDTPSGKRVLDNSTDRVYDGSDGSVVRPILSFSDNKRWIHAYKGDAPISAPLIVARPAAAAAPLRVAIANQRSVNAELLTFKTGFNR